MLEILIVNISEISRSLNYRMLNYLNLNINLQFSLNLLQVEIIEVIK